MHRDHRYQRLGRATLLGLILAVGLGIAILWGWNSFAVEMFALKPMRLRNALGLEVLLLAMAAPFPLLRRLFGAESR